MSLRVAFDLDGTLADMERVLRAEAATLFGEPSASVSSSGNARAQGAASAEPAESASDAASVDRLRQAYGDEEAGSHERSGDPPDQALDLSPRQWGRLWAHVRRIEDFWLSLPEIEDGIVARIAALAAARRWDVLFVTTRPKVKGQTTQVQTQKWLQEHGFALPSVYVVQRSRGRIADALELHALVDDRLENCVDVALESKAVPILVRPAPAAAAPTTRPVGVRVVGSIHQALTVLEQIDDERRRPDVVKSIRRWLGR